MKNFLDSLRWLLDLINLPTTGWYKEKFSKSNGMPPLGLFYIATILEQNHYRVKLMDFAVEKFIREDFENALKDLAPKVVGMSTYNESWGAQVVMSKIVKSIIPNAVITAGGAFATWITL